jgi:hypothetical protein
MPVTTGNRQKGRQNDGSANLHSLPARFVRSDFSARNESLESHRTLFNVAANATVDFRLRVVIEEFHQK